MNSSDSAFSERLISHPHQSLAKHLAGVDIVSRRALAHKYLAETNFFAWSSLEFWRHLLVYFHDFGKSTIYFQHKIMLAAEKENPALDGLDKEFIATFNQSQNRRQIQYEIQADKSIGSHARLGAYAIQANHFSEELLERAILMEIIRAHHGNLHDFVFETFDAMDAEALLKQQWENCFIDEYRAILTTTGYQLPNHIQDMLRQYGSSRFARKVTEALPTYDVKPYFLTLFLYSLLLAADKGDLMIKDAAYVSRIRIFPADLIDRYKRHTFQDQAAKPIDELRETAYQRVRQTLFQRPDQAFYSITLPTGLGKTFTAYNAAIHLQNLLGEQYAARESPAKPRIIYCLPFTSVIDQNAGILEDILQFQGWGNGHLARHHYLADFATQRDDSEDLSDSEKEYFTEGWEYDIMVTTFVQLLETIFTNRNRKLRKFHNLANAIIILDEVQNIPPAYFETVETAFQALHDYFNTRFIFVTATQPFLIQQNEVLELTDASQSWTREVFSGMNRIEMDISKWLYGPFDEDELLSDFQQAVEKERDKSFLFIFNKVKDSQRAYEHFKQQNPNAHTVYLSAAIVPVVRKRRIKEIKDFYKNKNESRQLIVVSTQVVEAGVDIDLDVVYRAFAPLDSINQSAGRCNRNGMKGKGQVRIFGDVQSAQVIYDTTLLSITEKVLRQTTDKLGSHLIPEGEFYDINQAYAAAVREKIADDNAASSMIDDMKWLRFATLDKRFKLIKQDYKTYSVFIELVDEPEATVVRREYEQIVTSKLDRWEKKKRLRQLRPRLLEYVVQIPEKYLPAVYKNDEVPIIFLNDTQYPDCYHPDIGYGNYLQEEAPNQAMNC